MDNFWAAIATISVSILGGGLAMAWRLGRLEQRVFDLRTDVEAIERRVEAYLMNAWEASGRWDGRERRHPR